MHVLTATGTPVPIMFVVTLKQCYLKIAHKKHMVKCATISSYTMDHNFIGFGNYHKPLNCATIQSWPTGMH